MQRLTDLPSDLLRIRTELFFTLNRLNRLLAALLCPLGGGLHGFGTQKLSPLLGPPNPERLRRDAQGRLLGFCSGALKHQTQKRGQGGVKSTGSQWTS